MDWKDLLGWLFILTSVFDSIKYRWNAQKIRQVKSARGHSRKFINVAILNDLVRMAYALVIRDGYILFSSVLALACMFELFVCIYLYYPYKHRHQVGFKRPSLLYYFWNSLIPNRIAKKL